MSGTELYPVKVTLRDPVHRDRQLTYTIVPEDNKLAHDWLAALQEILQKNVLTDDWVVAFELILIVRIPPPSKGIGRIDSTDLAVEIASIPGWETDPPAIRNWNCIRRSPRLCW